VALEYAILVSVYLSTLSIYPALCQVAKYIKTWHALLSPLSKRSIDILVSHGSRLSSRRRQVELDITTIHPVIIEARSTASYAWLGVGAQDRAIYRQHRFLQWQEAKSAWYAYLEHQLLCVVSARIEMLVQVTVPKSHAAPSFTSTLKIAFVKFPAYATVCQS